MVELFSQCLTFNLIIAHDLKPSRKCANLFIIRSRYNIFMIYFGNSPKISFTVNYIFKYLTLKILFLFYFMDYHDTLKNGGHHTFYLSRVPNLTPPPQSFCIFRYKTFRSDIFIISFYYYEVIQH